MDEITRHLKQARVHFNDSPVKNKWFLLWSRAYRADMYDDYISHTIRRGRMQDGRVLIPPCISHEVRRRLWRYWMFHSEAMWQKG